MLRKELTIKAKTIHYWAFFIMAGICILNLNYPLSVRFGISRPLSVMILGCAVVCVLTTRYSIPRSLGRTGFFFLAWIGLYIIAATLSAIVMGNYSGQTLFMVNIYTSSIIVILVSSVAGFSAAQEDRLQPFLRVLFYLCMTSTVLILFSDPIAQAFQLDRHEVGRGAGFFRNPNEAGQMCCLTLLLAFTMLRGARFPLIYLICIGVIYMATLLTFSKGAILTAGLLTIGQVVSLRGSWRFSIWWTLVAIAFVFAFAWLLKVDTRYLDVSASGKRRIQQIRSLVIERELTEETTTNRLFLNRYGLDLFWESPLIGHGLGTFTKMEGIRLGCHNTYLMIIGEAGAVLGILFLLLLWRVLGAIFRCRSPLVKQLGWGYMIVLGLAMIVSHNELYRRYHNIFLGLVLGMIAGRHYYLAKLAGAEAAAASETEASVVMSRPEPETVGA